MISNLALHNTKSTPRLKRFLLGTALALAGFLPSGAGFAQPLDDSGFGFVLRSVDFGEPCTDDLGNIPRIFDNASARPVNVSFKIINTGESNLFITDTGFIIPPNGPQRRPRIIRLTVAPSQSIGVRAQSENCAWIAIIRPH